MVRHNVSVAVVILLATVGLNFNGLAEPVSSSLAARAVNTLISQGDQMECPIDGAVSSVRRCSATNGAAFYVAKLTGGGFVVTSADTEIDPIIAISSEPDLVEDPKNPLWVLLTGDMAARKDDLAASSKARTKLMRAGASGAAPISDAAARWANLTAPAAAASPASGAKLLSAGAGGGSGAGKSKISDVRVAPLLKTKWGQSYVAGKPCFNYYTPSHYLCGCTATASAQILRYHKFPTEPVTPHTFERGVDWYSRELTQMGGVYDWNNMPYVPRGNMTTAQRKAIGKLTYDVGLAVNEYYSANSTWGYLSRFVDLCHEWGYAHATDYYDGKNYNRDQLKFVLIPNLEASLPVAVRVYSAKNDGHFVVADGYGYLDKLFSVHLNFGWDGDSDAWYVLPGKTTSGYNGLDELCGNIYPHGPKRGGIVSGRVLSASTKKPVSGIVVTATNVVGTVFRTKTNAKGIYSFILPSDEDDSYWPDDYFEDEPSDGGDGDGANLASTLVGGDWDDDWDDYYDDDDWVDDDYGYVLPYDSRDHVSIKEVMDGQGDSDGYWDEDEDGEPVWVPYDEGHGWTIFIENASPASRPLVVWDAKNYYDQNFSVRLYTVKFNPNGGSGGVVSRTCNVLGTLPETKRAGYSFMGWFTAPDGGVQVTETTEPAGSATYYAHWLANPYTVVFGANGGEGHMDPMDFVYGEEKPLSPGEFAKGDADFHGWSLSPRGPVAFKDGETVANLTSVSNGVVTLYAAWYGDVFAVDVGEYIKASLPALGYGVPTDGTAYGVVAYGLPAGLQLKCNAAVKDKNGKVVKAAKSEWWIEGVPTAAIDYATNPAYLVITTNGVSETLPLYLETPPQEIEVLDDLALGQSVNTNGWLAGVGAGWTVSGLPAGLSFATKKVTKKLGSKTVTVAEAYAVYGKATKAGLFTITAKRKTGAFYETLKYRVLVKPASVDTALFGEELANITTMAYVPVEWDLTGDGGHAGRVPLPVVENVAKVAGLPGGIVFAAKDTYAYTNAKKKTGKYLKQAGQTIVGTPTKPGTYVVTFTKNVTTGTGKNKKTVAKTAQILWTVTANDANLELGFNTAGGVIEGGTVGLKYGDLMAFSATDGAAVTASGLPKGIALANLGDGNYAFTGFTAKAGTYLVTVKATLKGKTVTQRMALEVDGLPSWAKGTFNGYIAGVDGATNGLATITVSSVGKISGKFYEGGTNWTFTAASYTGYDDAAPAYSVPVVAKYSYKEKEKVKVKGKWTTKTVTKSVSRNFTLRVGQDALGGVATLEEVGGGSTVNAWQNLWGSAYKAVGKRLFSTKSGKKTLSYRTFTIKGTDDVGAEMGLADAMSLSLKVTTAGAVTATMSFDTGTKSKGKAVIYKPTCSTVVIPLSAADAEEFEGEAILFFAPSTANGFPGFAGAAPF